MYGTGQVTNMHVLGVFIMNVLVIAVLLMLFVTVYYLAYADRR